MSKIGFIGVGKLGMPVQKHVQQKDMMLQATM